MKTSDKILDVARQLFNESGIRNTTTRGIAVTMAISPGNLHYHFKHTEDIVIALFRQLIDWYDHIIEQVQYLSLECIDDLIPILELIYEKMDEFRFLFLHFVEIGIWIPDIRIDYQHLVAKRENQFINWLERLEEQGVLVTLSPQIKTNLVKKLFIVGDFWMSYNTLSYRYSGIEAKKDYVDTMMSLLLPYVKDR
ncbi:TetR/AcrR family transcriptional regulator [Sphingobacterium sp. SYP-B4668]|uniref:TetR/AcrR family transcriptional regulator n=1 Tax=Sphingobacterium sp. SYP-B4668 TaxID=2996035 RepID=UPI0022DD82EF|nr:TetR/AcrR family transcriptional regulator [Sphingobacterium sp. SYP-B4668]